MRPSPGSSSWMRSVSLTPHHNHQENHHHNHNHHENHYHRHHHHHQENQHHIIIIKRIIMKACPDQIAERLGASLTQLVLAWSLRNNTSQVGGSLSSPPPPASSLPYLRSTAQAQYILGGDSFGSFNRSVLQVTFKTSTALSFTRGGRQTLTFSSNNIKVGKNQAG